MKMLCRECASKIVDTDSCLFSSKALIIFYFRPKGKTEYHVTASNNTNDYKVVLSYLKNATTCGSESNVSHLTKDEIEVLKQMTGISVFQLPKSVALELTYRCNHHCLFCSCPWFEPRTLPHLLSIRKKNYSKGEELSVQEWKKAVDILYSNGVTHFSITGGEFLLKEDFEEILKHIRTEGCKRGLEYPIVAISNGKEMTEEYLQLFKELNVHLSMSLPGYATFEKHTGVDNADGVLHWFQVAKRIGLKTTLNVTVTQLNYHELFQVLSLGLINGADDILLNRFLPGGRGLYLRHSLCLTPEQVNGMLDTAEEVLTHANRYGNVGTEIPLCVIKDVDKYQHIHFGYQCAAAKGFFVVDPSGKIRTCNHSPHDDRRLKVLEHVCL